MPSKQVEQATQIYARIAEDYAKKTLVTNNYKELDLLTANLRPGGKIGDIGCGPGRDIGYLLDKGLSVIGVDLTTELLQIAQKRSPEATFIRGDLCNIPLRTNSLDAVCSFAALQHLPIEDFPAAIFELVRILKVGGSLFVATKEGKGFVSVPGDVYFPDPREYTLVSMGQMDAWLVANGMTQQQLYSSVDDQRPEISWVNCLYTKQETSTV